MPRTVEWKKQTVLKAERREEHEQYDWCSVAIWLTSNITIIQLQLNLNKKLEWILLLEQSYLTKGIIIITIITSSEGIWQEIFVCMFVCMLVWCTRKSRPCSSSYHVHLTLLCRFAIKKSFVSWLELLYFGCKHEPPLDYWRHTQYRERKRAKFSARILKGTGLVCVSTFVEENFLHWCVKSQTWFKDEIWCLYQ